MSTLPHDSIRNSADVRHRAAVAPAASPGLEEILHEFESAATALGINRPSRADLSGLCREVAAFTTELFPGELTVKVRNDPDISDDLFLVFEVAATGDIEEIAARNDEWHDRICRLPIRGPGLFRLSIDVR